MIYNMDRPSDNMNLSHNQINKMLREQDEELYKAQQDKNYYINEQYAREREEHANYVNEYFNSKLEVSNSRAKFLENTKTNLLASVILNLYEQSLSFRPNRYDRGIMTNIITNFINEQGAGDLLRHFKYQNTYLAEMGSIVTKAYNAILESITDDNPDITKLPKTYTVPQECIDDFYKDAAMMDTQQVSSLIKEKVADAVNDFVDSNLQSKIEYKSIIDEAKEKINNLKAEEGEDEDSDNDTKDTSAEAEEIKQEAARQVNEMRRVKQKNVFHYLVESITKQSLSDENMRARYLHESSVDMDSITHTAELIYTMLEMVNTTEMVSEEYIRNYIESLVNNT